MFLSSPANDLGILADEDLSVVGQTNGHDVLLEDHVGGQPDEGQVVAEVGWVVFRMHVLALLQG